MQYSSGAPAPSSSSSTSPHQPLQQQSSSSTAAAAAAAAAAAPVPASTSTSTPTSVAMSTGTQPQLILASSSQQQPHGTESGNSAPPTEKKKKRLTQACQHCRKKKIRCDGFRPSCKNCIKNKMICTYLPSVRKRGRNGHRMSMMPAYVASGPYDRPMQTQSQAQIQSLSSLAAHHSMLSSNSSTSTGAAPRHQQGQFQPQQTVYNMSGLIPQQSLSQYQQQQQQQQQQQHQSLHSLQHQFLPPPPPPPPAASQPQINPLGSNFMSGGPVSLHLKRDPGFGQNPMEEAMYDQSKQAQEMSSHFLLPVNSLHYSAFTPNYGSQFGSHAGSSNQHGRYGITSGSSSKRNDGSSSQMGLSGANTSYTHRTPSGSNTGQQGVADLYSNGALSSTAAKIKASQPATIPSNFDPAALAQNLSSAYVSVVANMPTSHGSHQDVSTAAAPPAKSANARGKSSSHTPLGMFSEDNDVSPATAAKMRELRKKILSIISSVWADTECGRSAGMAGVTVADEDIGVEHGLGSSNGNDNNSSCDPLKDCSPNISPSGCQSTADVALCQGIKSMATMVSPSGDRSMDDHLINIFFDYVHQQLPIINRTEFTKSYQQGKVSMLLICAMCSAASVFLNRIEDERKSIYELYSQKVREMFHDACFEPSLEVVQTALIMTLCEYRHGSLHRAWVYLSMGFRLAIAMGYHHHDSKLRAGPMQSTADIAHRETCRRAFWGAFLLDRYTAIGGGKALGINDNDISVLLPLRDEDWHSPEIAPPLSALEFFKPVNLRQIKNPDTGMKTDVSLGKGSDSGSSRGCSEDTSASESSSGSPLAKCASLSRNGTPLSPGDGWDSRASETSPLGYFIKLMSVVGQVAQHINTKKSIRPQSSIAKDGSPKSERPSQGYAALDAALLRWKEELPSSLLYSEAKSMDAEPETAVFIACMHAIYHGAVIMLNRENMGLLRDLPGQLDISTNLAIRSLERCRVAAMEVVEITHYICSLPAAMTNALLPWALFQAGTLLIHFMIAGSTPQAQEEARSAILSLDSALRDELSRYWNVSTKYHLILSNMVKAWERTRQVTPNMTPNQQTKSQFQPESSSSISDSAANALQAFNSHMVLPMQMQMQMQLPTAVSSSQGGMVQQQEQAQKQSQPIGQAEAFSTLLKPYSAPVSSSMSSGSDRTQSCAVGMGDISDPQQRQQHTLAAQQSLGGAIDAMARSQGLNSNFLFTPDTAQDSINTLNAFFSQLSQEQARQINEGLQSYYALQGNAGSENMSFVSQSVNGSAMLANPAAVSSAHSQQVATSVCQMQKQQQPRPYVLANPAIQQLQAEGLDSLSQSRLQIRRGSLPISSNGDLFRAPGAPMPPISTSSVSSSGSSFGPSMFLQQAGTSDSTLPPDLDPLLFNPMTPFLQELQMFNSAASIQQQQQQQQQQQSVMPSRSSRNQPSGSFGDSNANSHSF